MNEKQAIIDLIIEEIKKQTTPSFLAAIQTLKEHGIINLKMESMPMTKK